MNEPVPEKDIYQEVRLYRSTERAEMIATIQELIQEARKRVKSKKTPPAQKPRWAMLAGKLIWYNDQILRSLNYEVLQKEVNDLKEQVFKRPSSLLPPPSSTTYRRRRREAELPETSTPANHPRPGRKRLKSAPFAKTSKRF